MDGQDKEKNLSVTCNLGTFLNVNLKNSLCRGFAVIGIVLQTLSVKRETHCKKHVFFLQSELC